jgi:quercetin dioxygenase-like cupin family protein
MNDDTTTATAPAELAPQAPPGVAPDSAWGLAPTLAAGLCPIDPPPEREAALRARLLDRVARSASAHRAFVTVRAQDGAWQALGIGVRCRGLHADEHARTRMLSWHDEATLCLGASAHAHELLVLSGQVRCLHQAEDPPLLQADDYLLLPPGMPVQLQARAGARLYWRRIAHDKVSKPFGHAAPSVHLARAAGIAWVPLRQGVRVKPLYAEDDRLSMLVRFEPGARVPPHGHDHGEECLMVEGDLFLGDVLLRQGDFQFAPRGTGHGELHSDVGCVLFFHGAVDPAVVDTTPRAA